LNCGSNKGRLIPWHAGAVAVAVTLQRMTSPSTANIAYAPIRELQLVVLYHGRKNPNDTEWKPYVQLLHEIAAGNPNGRVLVITEGGHPSREQQVLMDSSLPKVGTRVAVISPSVVARFVTSILVLTNAGIRCFSPEQRQQAYRHLGLLPQQTPPVEKLVKQLGHSLGLEP
jgi:hypothetical protein